jgi:putative hydrolase of the HAD superfamily
VTDRLGITSLFTGIFDIRAGRYVPKPEPAPYADLVALHAINPKRAIMFEDIHRNLKPAAALGMSTVWLRHPENPAKPDEDLSHCHFVTEDLIAWLEDYAPAKT